MRFSSELLFMCQGAPGSAEDYVHFSAYENHCCKIASVPLFFPHMVARLSSLMPRNTSYRINTNKSRLPGLYNFLIPRCLSLLVVLVVYNPSPKRSTGLCAEGLLSLQARLNANVLITLGGSQCTSHHLTYYSGCPYTVTCDDVRIKDLRLVLVLGNPARVAHSRQKFVIRGCRHCGYSLGRSLSGLGVESTADRSECHCGPLIA